MEEGAEVFCDGFGFLLIGIHQRYEKDSLLSVIAILVEISAFVDGKRERHMIALTDVFHDIDIRLGAMLLLLGGGIVQPYV